MLVNAETVFNVRLYKNKFYVTKELLCNVMIYLKFFELS
jgi:hypothetical protein